MMTTRVPARAKNRRGDPRAGCPHARNSSPTPHRSSRGQALRAPGKRSPAACATPWHRDRTKTGIRQEVAVFAQRVDVAEELARLNTHIDEVERILSFRRGPRANGSIS